MSTVLGGNKKNWKSLTDTQKKRYIQLQKYAPSYPWQPTAQPMRGGSRIRDKRGFMQKSSRFWENVFDMDRDCWVCAKHPTVQRVLDYLCRKAGGRENASLQSRRNILIALSKFCQYYSLSPEDACKLPASNATITTGSRVLRSVDASEEDTDSAPAPNIPPHFF